MLFGNALIKQMLEEFRMKKKCSDAVSHQFIGELKAQQKPSTTVECSHDIEIDLHQLTLFIGSG